MLQVRAARSVDDLSLAGGDDDLRPFVEEAWADGSSRPGWCFVVERDGEVVGRVGFTLEPSTSDPAWLGTLPPTELHAFGLRWHGGPAVGARLLAHAFRELGGLGPAHAEVRVNRRREPAHRDQVAVLASMGELFQEKAGFELDGTTLAGAVLPERLRWADVDEVGVERYATIMGRCGEGTLDRNDAYYWGHCGPDNWGRQMMEYLDPDDADMWLVGFDGDDPVGYVAVASDPELVSTIEHIGVLPEARGRGYVHDLLAAVGATLVRRGIPSMLSDVDVHNRPMADALRRAGHRESDWHVWQVRCPVGHG
jgi:RimJ/RimL family protein N-acetyltransferase